jgi:hypothetical protein
VNHTNHEHDFDFMTDVCLCGTRRCDVVDAGSDHSEAMRRFVDQVIAQVTDRVIGKI